MPDIAVESGRITLLLKEIGTNVHALAVVEADGAGDPDVDAYVPVGDLANGKQVVERYKNIGAGYFAKTIYLSSGSEGSPAAGDVIVAVGQHGLPIMYKDMGDGSHAEVVMQAGSTSGTDRIYPSGKVNVRYRALGNGAFARVVAFAESEEIEANDVLQPSGAPIGGFTPSIFYKRMLDGTHAQVLYPFEGEIEPPDPGEEFGLMFNGNYLLFNGNYLVLS